MTQGSDAVSQFYMTQLKTDWAEKLSTDCPFCQERGFEPGNLIVFLKRDSFFHGFFRCSNRCVAGGYALWYARLAGIPFSAVPGYNRDNDAKAKVVDYPVQNINEEVNSYRDQITEELLEVFKKTRISKATLREVHVGFNGRYIVYPYFQEDGNCYSARCVHPEKPDDFFWHGDDNYTRLPYNIFNLQDIGRCENGALFLCEGEENVLTLKHLGFPAVGVYHNNILEKIPPEMFAKVETLFISVNNRPESINSARNFAAQLGHKARILRWGANRPRNYHLWKLAEDTGADFAKKVAEIVKSSRAFSPFSTPDREFELFKQIQKSQQSDEFKSLYSGFSRLDKAIGGIYGINVIGGAPKVGKSTFMIQIASEMARRKIPVLYYDFENGRQKIYQRTLSRLSRLETNSLNSSELDQLEKERLSSNLDELKQMLFYWRVVNDRKITPKLMRKHIEFIRHETRSNYTIVIIDSLHKLPFKEFTERRSGIDAWLRQMESIRDELQVSFLVISELSRGTGGTYDEAPHLGIFKGSGDIEYSADNAMVLFPATHENDKDRQGDPESRLNTLWLVASREHSPGQVADYRLDFPYWGFKEVS